MTPLESCFQSDNKGCLKLARVNTEYAPEMGQIKNGQEDLLHIFSSHVGLGLTDRQTDHATATAGSDAA